jgi:hypothetical protein
LIFLVGFSGVSSVCYAKSRYEQLSKAMHLRFGSSYGWPDLPRPRQFGQPFQWIVSALCLLPVAHLLLLGILLSWTDRVFWIYGLLSGSFMLFGVLWGRAFAFQKPKLGTDPE